jgi:glutaconate CoA-transferase subunit A
MDDMTKAEQLKLKGSGAYESMPGRTSKLKSAEEAFAAVKDGMTISMTCTHYNSVPLAAMRQLIRQGTKNLTVIPTPSAGIAIDLLIAAKALKKSFVSYVGLETHGLAPNFRRAAEAGEIEISEIDEATVIYGLRAAAAALPYAVVPAFYKLHSLPKVNPDLFKEITDPFTGDTCFAMRPLKPDVAILHVQQCDEYGNARQLAGEHTEMLIAKAADHVIITTEEIIPHQTTTVDPPRTTVPGFLVNSVVRMPYGAHPGSCPVRYSQDDVHLAEYARLAQEGRTSEYIRKYVHECQDHGAYLDRVGATHLLNLNLY